VAILDAGSHWNPVKDFVSDEIASRKLFWTAPHCTQNILVDTFHAVAGYSTSNRLPFLPDLSVRSHPVLLFLAIWKKQGI
jgi:hypothetical protein